MKVITYEMALRALNEAVRAKGYDHVYEKRSGFCFNVYKGVPDCIVGHALVWLGVPVDWFAKEDCDNENIVVVGHALRQADMFEIEDDAMQLLTTVQRDQDERLAWGAAVTKAHLGREWFVNLNLHENVPA